MRVHISSNTGSYNWLAPSERQDVVTLIVALDPDGDAPGELITIHARWPEGGAPEIGEWLPSEVLDASIAQEAALWINTSRERDRAKFARLDALRAEMDEAWIRAKIESLEGKVKQWRERLGALTLTDQEEATA